MQTKRGRAGVPARPLTKRFVRSASGGSIQIVIAHDRPRILALGRNVAVDELDDRHRRRIRRADAGLDDAGIAALAIGVTRAEHVEQLGELRVRSEEHTSELQALMRISYAGFCLEKKTNENRTRTRHIN